MISGNKRITKGLLLGLTCMTLMLAPGCTKEDSSNPATNNNPPTPPAPVVSLEDTLSRKWKIVEAWHNTSQDWDSEGMEITFYKNGKYLLHETQYQGTWEFQDNKTKMLVDKDEPDFKSTWTIVELTAKKLHVTFKSPFTGGNVKWVMEPTL